MTLNDPEWPWMTFELTFSESFPDMKRIRGSIFDELNNGYMQIYNQTCKKEIVDEGWGFVFSKIAKIFESSDFSKKFKISEFFWN